MKVQVNIDGYNSTRQLCQ